MILVGRYLSPFVRRVAITLNLYDMPYEHRPLPAFGDDKKTLQTMNPVARVPTLLLDDGEALIDSTAILDYLDEQAGPERALTPRSGAARREVLKKVAVAIGAIEKAVLVFYEGRFRPKEIHHAPWVDMCSTQARDGFRWLDGQLSGDFLAGNRLTQADVTAVAGYDFVREAAPALAESFEVPRVVALSRRLNEMDAFRSTAPGG